MSDHKTTNLHAPPLLGSVATTLINQHHQKIESIDYTADESMIADFMAVLPQLDPNDSSSAATSPTLKIRGQSSNESSKILGKFDAFAAAVQQQQQNGISIASALVKKVQQQLLPATSGLSTVQSSSSSSSSPSTINQIDYQSHTNTNNTNNKRKRKVERPAQKRIRGSYKLVSPEQKIIIHEYAEKHGVKAASKLFQVAPSTIASWLYQKPNGERTSAIRNKEAHSSILQWIQTRQENGERVNNRDFHSYALSTMRDLTGNPDFAASRSWCSNFLKKYNIQLDSDKQADSTSAQFRFDSIDENASESSQCYMGDNSPADVLTDEDDSGQNLHISHDDDDDDGNQTSPHRFSASDYNNNHQTNSNNCVSPSSQTKILNGIDNVSTTTTTTVIKVEQDNDCNYSSSPSSPSIQTLPNKISVTTSLPVSSSSSIAGKRLTGTLNRLLHSAINRPNGHHYHHHVNGVSSSPSASSTTTLVADSTAKEPKISLEMTTPAIETFVQHFDSSFNTMTYFQEKLQQLLVSIAQERDTYRTLYLKEHDRRLAAELRLKESNNTIA
ncbi:unnamed protein product [Rotaria sordida]|uniref:HTH CENPB-type domain-containing protein n=1 Tax=Rotaria sordida TaxID=392033 RepID=A0A818TLZ1_9BILA|nr:unnamed protein product [Rotaria sordida]CAF1027375.1 unnamed protein product [Rotaria sordida]CAF3686419.1 unnamed protein product [Rotaria sordida]CAF3729280.1 unnamed protein product [Rotaria sordida]